MDEPRVPKQRRSSAACPPRWHRRRWLKLPAVAALCVMDRCPASVHVHVMGASSATPRGRPLVGRLMGRRRGREENKGGGLTLGELEEMMRKDDGDERGIANDVSGPAAIFGADGSAGNAQSQQPQIPERADEATPPSMGANQLRRGLGRINLDLSRRIMCHVVSPIADADRFGGESVPLFTVPTEQQSATNGSAGCHEQSTLGRGLRRFVPNVYLGANYDLDEVWYGATRWIGRCSWGPLSVAGTSGKESNTGGKSKSEPMSRRTLQLVHRVQRRIFPSSPLSMGSRWTIEAEGERSVFDGRDTTARLRLIQSPFLSASSEKSAAVQSPLQISLEHDSAKYHEAPPGTKRSLLYAPAVTTSIRTPFLHRRLEIHSTRTWIVKEGGDRQGNYYGGDHFGGESCAHRRLESAKARIRESVRRSNPALDGASEGNTGRGWMSRLSQWLESDGWMPKRVTADLAGNLVSVSEVGFGGDSGGSCDKTHQQRSILPFRNAGLRLRVSKKMDWTTLGIFPWSKNGVNGHGHGEGHAVLDALQSTHLRLELCGLHASGVGRSSIGVRVDPLDWKGSLNFTIGHESVGIV